VVGMGLLGVLGWGEAVVCRVGQQQLLPMVNTHKSATQPHQHQLPSQPSLTQVAGEALSLVVPCADMANHSMQPNAGYQLNAESGCFQLIAVKVWARGLGYWIWLVIRWCCVDSASHSF